MHWKMICVLTTIGIIFLEELQITSVYNMFLSCCWPILIHTSHVHCARFVIVDYFE